MNQPTAATTRNKPGAARQSNLELLRILSALMIIACHFSTFGHFEDRIGFTERNLFLAALSPILGYGGVCIFVLISGYFSVNSKFNWQRVAKIALETTFYALTVYLVMTLSFHKQIDASQIVKTLLAVLNGYYWYPTVFIALMIISPFLNKLLHSLSTKSFRRFLLVLFITVCAIPTFLNVNYIYNDFVMMIFYYSAAAYVRLHPQEIFNKKLLWATVSVVSWIGAAFATVWRVTATKTEFSQYYTPNFGRRNGVLVFTLGMGLFLFFRSLKLPGSGSSRIINTLSSTTLGVYLAHTHPNVVRDWLFFEQFHSAEKKGWALVITAAFATVTIFFVC
ncbi:MAG: acyltransferase [Oscillospiraceae bacterium]|jgi:hypothetical protein|nr:acyltransferase [Oscillospiraceae bacterium]